MVDSYRNHPTCSSQIDRTIHGTFPCTYQDGNNRDDIKVRFLVTMLCTPGKPMLTLVDDVELVARRDRRVSAAAD